MENRILRSFVQLKGYVDNLAVIKVCKGKIPISAGDIWRLEGKQSAPLEWCQSWPGASTAARGCKRPPKRGHFVLSIQQEQQRFPFMAAGESNEMNQNQETQMGGLEKWRCKMQICYVQGVTEAKWNNTKCQEVPHPRGLNSVGR